MNNMNINIEDLAFFPIKHEKLHEMYEKLRKSFWQPDEIDFTEDIDLNPPTPIKRLRNYNLFFFAQSDGMVNENLMENFIKETSFIKEAKHFYTMQAANELIHNETYSILIQQYIPDIDEQLIGFNAIKNIPSIRNIYEWSEKFMNSSLPLLERIIAFAALEGVIFSGSFRAIFWIRDQGYCLGLAKANEWIQKDESLHADFAVELYKTLIEYYNFEPIAPERILEIIHSAVEVAGVFNEDAIPEPLVGLSAESLTNYTKEVANKLCKDLCGGKIYELSDVPREDDDDTTMAALGLPNKTNFFESRVSEYGTVTATNFVFTISDEF